MKKFIKEKNGKKNFSKKKTVAAFTFVETIAVLAIGAVLAAGTTVSATKLIASARKTTAKNQIEQYSSALQSYFLDCGCFPTTEQGLSALWEEPVFYPIPENWNGPYLDRKPSADPWGTDFKYLCASSSPMPEDVPVRLPYVLISYGADGKEGGEGENADIYSWK